MTGLRVPLYVTAVVISFIGVAALIIFISRSGLVTPEMGALMLVALVGLYVGFGVLVLVFRLVLKLK